jgi:uncharacterized protein YaaQ
LPFGINRGKTKLKLILATIQDADAERVVKELTAQGDRVTRIGSTGGFLQQGNTTLLLGLQEDRVDSVLTMLRRVCQHRTAFVPVAAAPAPNNVALYNYLEVEVGGAIAFVLDVEQFEQI